VSRATRSILTAVLLFLRPAEQGRFTVSSSTSRDEVGEERKTRLRHRQPGSSRVHLGVTLRPNSSRGLLSLLSHSERFVAHSIRSIRRMTPRSPPSRGVRFTNRQAPRLLCLRSFDNNRSTIIRGRSESRNGSEGENGDVEFLSFSIPNTVECRYSIDLIPRSAESTVADTARGEVNADERSRVRASGRSSLRGFHGNRGREGAKLILKSLVQGRARHLQAAKCLEVSLCLSLSLSLGFVLSSIRGVVHAIDKSQK